MTLEQLVAAYKSGTVTEPLMIDNDATCVYQGDDKVFEAHPDELLEEALRLLGVPFEGV